MYVNVEKLEATKDNVVLEIQKWPSSIASTSLVIVPESVNRYDNGRELYLAKVASSGNEMYKKGDTVAIDIYYGIHIPVIDATKRVKIVPASGIVLKTEKEFKVMSDLTRMEPGKDRIYIKIAPKVMMTPGGLHIPDMSASQDPTAQDIRLAEVVKSNSDEFKPGDNIIVEAEMGKDIFVDEEKNVYRICYAGDILATITDK